MGLGAALNGASDAFLTDRWERCAARRPSPISAPSGCTRLCAALRYRPCRFALDKMRCDLKYEERSYTRREGAWCQPRTSFRHGETDEHEQQFRVVEAGK